MKYEVTTFHTKKLMSASLKKLMETKSLSKITVSEIISDCGLNRKTFYYHFQDIQALLQWTLEQEAFEVIKKYDLILEYDEAISFVIDYVERNKHILNCAYDSIGRDELKRFLYNDFIEIMMSIIDLIEEIQHVKADENYKGFLCEFYTEALVGVIIDLLKNKKQYDKQRLIEFVSTTITISLPVLLRHSHISCPHKQQPPPSKSS